MNYTQHGMVMRRPSKESGGSYVQRTMRPAPYMSPFPQGTSTYGQPLMNSGGNGASSYNLPSTAEGRFLPMYEASPVGRSNAGLLPPMSSNGLNARTNGMPGYYSNIGQPPLSGNMLPPNNPYNAPLGIPYGFPSLLPYQNYNFQPSTPETYPFSRPLAIPSQSPLIGHANVLPTNPGAPIQTTKDIQGPEGCNLFVFHIPNDLTNTDLYSLFSEYGIVISARIMVDKVTGRSRGFGFVSFEKRENAEEAIAGMNGYQIGHKRLKVQHKKEKEKMDYSIPYPLQGITSAGLSKPTSTTYYHHTYLNKELSTNSSDVDEGLAEKFQSALRIDTSRPSIQNDYDSRLDFGDVNQEGTLDQTGVVIVGPTEFRSPESHHILKGPSAENGRAPIAWVGGSNPAQGHPDDSHNFEVSSGSTTNLWVNKNLRN